jgi:lipoprotein-anchoring transpeptidase ErfK/SrfK
MFYSRTLFLIALLLGFASGGAFGNVTPSTVHLREGKAFFKSGKWDPAEIAYLKAAKSSLVEERIQAYEGLHHLYSTLRLFKKAEKARKKWEAEKAFKERLVPSDGRYYQSYQVKNGDSYAKIASRLKISQKWLEAANGRKPLRAANTIRVPLLRDELIADKTKKTLTWKRGEEVIKIYPIAIGQEGMETPEGEFEVINKAKDPVWYRLGKIFPPDSPENLLGTRWLGISKKGYGIHGTRSPGTIGSRASHGCVRLHNADIEELFEWIPLGAKVRIHSSKN